MTFRINIKNYCENMGFIVVLLLAITNSFALTSDEKQPAKLSSDSAICKHQTNEDNCIYSGNARFNQGTTNLQASKITIYKKLGKIKKIVASGKHSSYSTVMDDNNKQLTATADLITIEPENKTIVLEKNGQVKIDKDEYSGPYIKYKIE